MKNKSSVRFLVLNFLFRLHDFEQSIRSPRICRDGIHNESPSGFSRVSSRAKTKESTYRTVVANPYLFGVALVSRNPICNPGSEADSVTNSSRHLEGSFWI
jgi:hypothetical protein